MIKILVDSASDINAAEAEQLGVIMVPMLITIGKQEFYDGVDITACEFYDKLIESDEQPKTSQVNPFAFEEQFEKHTKNGDQIIAITISSKLSGTYQSACQAAEKFAGKVFVVDSMSACIGERLLCDYAQRLIKQGLTAEQIVEQLNVKKEKLHVMALVATLEYLKRGGRISSALAFAGELIALKPVVGMVNGEVKLIGKALGSRKGNNLLNQLVKNSGGIDFDMPFGTIWSGSDEQVLNKYIKDSAELWAQNVDSVPRYALGATIGTHTGPGVVGVAFFEK